MELSKNYNPATVEDKWYKHWLKKGYFISTPDERKPFTVVIPPPNVTGVLHMGHTLNEAVQDILVRRARMSGYNACWVPGSDHSSIATESKVVQMLKEKGIDKNDLSREEFLRYAFEWKEKYGNIIYSQIAKLGCSVDWKRVTFTMDDHYYKAVIKVFVQLYNEGLIYRGARMIHWDPAARTALSDEEVEYKDVKGKLYYVRYKLADDNTASEDEGIVIATQRPETIMGDTAVCVNPNDERYKHLAGRKVIVPLINKAVPVIFDEYVDPAFGTGALKITPAHDINDYNIGLKHNLEVVDTLNENGTISAAAKVFVGLDRFAARIKAVEQLREEGLLVKEEDYTTRLGYSQRSSAVVEPRISTQWFVKMKELAKPALEAVLSGNINIHPGEKFLATYKYWMENVKDWCISRQLWWGQQIPAWYDADGNVFVAENKEAVSYQLSAISSKYKVDDLRQDADVLDTWFSSWLWPIQVFKGITDPGNKDVAYYYPGSVLVTGQDIIFFWVARMIIAGMHFKDEKPFSDVYFTGMVRDKLGRKMSKQLGNSPDLLMLIDKYGADAVRFGIMISSPAGNDLLFDEGSLEQGRNFNNKLWNAMKLVKMWEGRQLEVKSEKSEEFPVTWFENRLNEVKADIEKLFKQFQLSEALKLLYSLVWDDFCSWYLEWIKPGFEQPIDKTVYDKTVFFFEQLLQLLHPFMPFITEEIFHLLKEQQEDLCVKQIEQLKPFDKNVLELNLIVADDIRALRETKAKYQIKFVEQLKFSGDSSTQKFYVMKNPALLKILEKQTNCIYDESYIFHANSEEKMQELALNEVVVVAQESKFFLLIGKEKINIIEEKKSLEKDLEYQKKFLESVLKKLSNERFVQNAKPEIIQTEKKKQADAEARIKTIEESLANI